MKRRVLLLVALAVGGMSPRLAAENWPMFRGENARGIATGTEPPVVWDLTTSNHVRWKTPVPGLGHSSPVIWGHRLFLTTAVNEKKRAELKVGLYGDPDSAADDDPQSWKILCFDKRSGALLWERTAQRGVPRQKRHTKASHANCTVATDGRRVVAFFGSEGIHCYDLSGKLIWTKDLGTLRISPIVYNDVVDMKMSDLEWGFSNSPVLHDGRVFIQCDALTNGFVAALDLKDGRELWRTRRDDTGTWSTPNVLVTGRRAQLVVNGWKHMGGYDVHDGTELWRMSGGGDCPVPTPVFDGGLIYLMSAHGPRRPIYAVRADATGDVSLHDGATTNRHVAWSVARNAGSYMQTPVILGDLLYSCHVDGILSCLEARTGRLVYKERLGGGSEGFTASPVASRTRLYFTGENGTIVVVQAGREFRVLATNLMEEVCMATPAISDGTLYFRTQGNLVAIGESH